MTGLAETNGQYRDKLFGISANLSYITSSKLFLFPNVSDPIVRSQFIPLEDILAYSSEFRYAVLSDLMIGLGVEYIEKTVPVRNMVVRNSQGNLQSIIVDDGYRVYPVKLTLYYVMPFSMELFKFFMAGGIGVYFAQHVRKSGTLELSNESDEFAYGIHVSIGMDYLVTDYFGIRSEILFRDPEFEMKSKYVSQEFEADGEQYTILRESFSSKVNIDGTCFSIGVFLYF
jgi:hypothetical protein